MKSLNEIEDSIKKLKEDIFCQETGNDFYYSSPLYHEQLLQLEAWENEARVLCGKEAPLNINFNYYPPKKQLALREMAQKNGCWYANSFKDLSEDELNYLKNSKNRE